MVEDMTMAAVELIHAPGRARPNTHAKQASVEDLLRPVCPVIALPSQGLKAKACLPRVAAEATSAT